MSTTPLLQPSLPLPGPFTARQANAAGLTRSRLRALLQARTVRRVLTGVYTWADEADTVESRCRAARLVAPDHVVLCDRTAAWIWGVDAFEWHELEVLPPLETRALRGTNRLQREGCIRGARDLTPDDVVEVDGLLVTTPARTALDLACMLSMRDGLAVVDAFMRVCGVSRPELEALLRRFRGRRGVIQARAIAAVADARSESHGESWTRLAMIHADLPTPELQWWVYVDGVPTYRLDMAYPKHKVAVEYDGREFHSRPEEREQDRRRRSWLEAHGWTVVVVDRSMLTNASIGRWTDVVRAALTVD
jgi:hypothetical protein